MIKATKKAKRIAGEAASAKRGVLASARNRVDRVKRYEACRQIEAPRKSQTGEQVAANGDKSGAGLSADERLVAKGEKLNVRRKYKRGDNLGAGNGVVTSASVASEHRGADNGERTATGRKTKRGDTVYAGNGEHAAASHGGDTPGANNGDSRAATRKTRTTGESSVANGEQPDASRATSNGGGGKASTRIALSGGDADPANLCQEIVAVARDRRFYMHLRKQMVNAFKAKLRSHLGYRAGMAKEEAEPIKDLAQSLAAKLDTAQPLTAEQRALAEKAGASILVSTLLAQPVKDFEKQQAKRLESLAQQLHVAEWCAGIKGLGFLSLGTIIGETGDLANYSKVDKVWKRLGMAPFQAVRKNGETATLMPSTWRREGGLSAEQWTEVGYSPYRRSVMWNVAVSFVKSRGTYRSFYDEVKEKAAAKHPDWIKARVNNHAILLTGKRLIRDLYREWTKA